MKHFTDDSTINNDEHGILWREEYDHIYDDYDKSTLNHQDEFDEDYSFDEGIFHHKDDDYFGNDWD